MCSVGSSDIDANEESINRYSMQDIKREMSSPIMNNTSYTSDDSINLDDSMNGSGDYDDITSDSRDFAQSKEGRKYKKKKDEKTCKVCGDKALGYNFNAITCESCKAFFRRNALKDQEPKCLFQGNCTIDVRTRRFCPHCRLQRCFDIGMKKEMILDETERKARMMKVMQNREKKKKPSLEESSVNFAPQIKQEPQVELPSTSVSTMEDLLSKQDDTSLVTGSDDIANACIPELSDGHRLPPVDMFGQSKKPVEIPIINKAMLPEDENLYRKLTSEEKALLETITTAYIQTLAGFASNCGEDHVNNVSNYSTIDDLVNNSEIAVRRLIKFVKMLEDFKLLTQDDQIATLKACVLGALLLRSVNFYDIETDAWKTPTGLIPTEILKQATGLVNLHDSHTNYCKSLKQLSNDDVTVLALLQTIVIFNPEGQMVKNKTFISDIQDKYMVLLKHYLESEITVEYGQQVFVHLLLKVQELKGLSGEHAKILLQVDANQIEPLMLEVLNLK